MIKNIFSAFDGMSCGQIALSKLKIPYEEYYASEVEKWPIAVTQHNFPNTIQVGDVRNVLASDLPQIDLLIGGSPCQNFSFAGKMKGMTTKSNIEVTSLKQYLELKESGFEFQGQSYLFWEYVRLLKELKPKYFLLENVKMLKKWENLISDVLGVKPIEINSALVSAQNRRRLYWTNIPNVQQPEDKGVKLIDIIVDGAVDSRMTVDEKAYALTASYNGAVAWNSIERKQRTMILQAINGKAVHIDLFNEAPFSFYEARTEEGKEMRRKIRMETGKDSTPRNKEFKMYLPNLSGKGNCLVTIESPLDFIVDTSWKYRKLHPIEMERLQTVPDGYTSCVSATQARKMLGNGWTVDVIAHIFQNIK
jgi:DNA (cytosine-5)-methyltransferase 3A